MPTVEVSYYGLIRGIAACRGEIFELMPNATLRDLIAAIVRRHGEEMRPYLVSDDGRELASGSVVRIGRYAARTLDARLGASEMVEVVVMSPMLVGG